MCPISSISELFELLNNNSYFASKGRSIRYLVLLLFNPNNLTKAGQALLDNFEYLDLRTESVHFFIPGYSEINYNLLEKQETYAKYLLRDLRNGNFLQFDTKGFFNSIKWMEVHLTGFHFDEGTSMVIIDLRPLQNLFFKTIIDTCIDQNYYVNLDLDYLLFNGNNVNVVLSNVTRLIMQDCNLDDIRHYNARHLNTHEETNIFIAGSIHLKEERKIVRAELLSIQNRVDKLIRCKTVEDFPNDFVIGGRQKQYDSYIRNEADYVIFILDSKVGSITLDEFKIAISSFERTGHPKIMVYNRRYKDRIKLEPLSDAELNVSLIVSYCRAHNQYYTDYESDYELSNMIYRSFIDQLVLKMK